MRCRSAIARYSEHSRAYKFQLLSCNLQLRILWKLRGVSYFLQNWPIILSCTRADLSSNVLAPLTNPQTSHALRAFYPSMKTLLSPARALCALLTIGALSLLLAGCGGGGSGPNTPTPTATPTPVRQFKPNYLSDIETLRRWRQFPISVSFVRDANYTAAAQQRTLAGFDFWLKKIPNGPTLTVVASSQASDLTVSFYPFNGAANDVLGTTRVFSSTDPAFAGTISRAEMSLGITGNNTLDIATAAHEYGHALGILGHSKNPDDLMFFTGNDDRSGQLTVADVNSMLTNYNGVFPKGGNNRLAPIPGPFEVTEIH